MLASGRNVNIMVLDTEVYSNTGGQMSKSTPRAAVAKFAAAGKPLPKKDLGRLAMSYGNVYVAKVAFGANDRQTIQAIMEAEAYDGPSLIIAYSHCIAHGYDLKYGLEQQQAAVDSGHWVLYRYNPDLANRRHPRPTVTRQNRAKILPARLQSAVNTAGKYIYRRRTLPHVAAEQPGGGRQATGTGQVRRGSTLGIIKSWLLTRTSPSEWRPAIRV